MLVYSPLIALLLVCHARGFTVPQYGLHVSTSQSAASTSASSSTALHMAKNSLKKQADLRRKLELAKQQNKEETDSDSGMGDPAQKQSRMSDAELKEKNDRLRFEELLRKGSSSVLNDYSADGYLNQSQEEEEIEASREYKHCCCCCLFLCMVFLQTELSCACTVY
jgi:hypothetical protein